MKSDLSTISVLYSSLIFSYSVGIGDFIDLNLVRYKNKENTSKYKYRYSIY